MASEIHVPNPVCLIENVNGPPSPNLKALEILSAIKQPVVVVVMAGLYRTGKSYLMNKLAGKKTSDCRQQSSAESSLSPTLSASSIDM